MPKLEEATTILTALKADMTKQKAAAAQLASEQKYAEAIVLLNIEIAHYESQTLEAQLKRSSSKKMEKNQTLKAMYAKKYIPVVDALDTLRKDVDDLYAAMMTELAQYERHAKPASVDAAPVGAEAERAEAERAVAEYLATEREAAALEVAEDGADERAYQDALQQLQDLKTQPHLIALDEPLDRVIAEVEALKASGKESTAELTEALNKTYLRLTNQMLSDAYIAIANTMEGHPSTGMKVLGALMITLGLAIVALGVMFAPVLASLATTLALTGAVATAVVGTSVGLTGTAFVAPGITFFAKGFQQSGLSKAMSDVDKAEQASSNEELATPVV